MTITAIQPRYDTHVAGRGHCLIVDPSENPALRLDMRMVDALVQTPDGRTWTVAGIDREPGLTLPGCIAVIVTEYDLPI